MVHTDVIFCLAKVMNKSFNTHSYIYIYIYIIYIGTELQIGYTYYKNACIDTYAYNRIRTDKILRRCNIQSWPLNRHPYTGKHIYNNIR